MARRLRILLAMAGLAGLGLALAPTVAAGDPCYHGYTIPAVTTQATSTVKLEPCAFVPTITRVAPGDTVTFTNVSEETHLVFGANATWGDRDTEIPARGTRSVRFDRAGIYPYSCALHRGMSGVVVVGNSGGSDAAAASTTSTSSGDGGQAILTAIGMSGLAGLAVIGWGAALIQRRRIAAAEAARS
jgi:plastocyanin